MDVQNEMHNSFNNVILIVSECLQMLPLKPIFYFFSTTKGINKTLTQGNTFRFSDVLVFFEDAASAIEL